MMTVTPHRFVRHALCAWQPDGVAVTVQKCIEDAQFSARCFSGSAARRMIARNAKAIRRLLGWKASARVFIIE